MNKGLFVAAESSALGDILKFFFFEKDRDDLFFDAGGADHCPGKFLCDPAFLFNREAFFAFHNNNGHGDTFQKELIRMLLTACG